MRKLNRKPSKILFSGLLILLVLLVGSCESWMSNDNFMEQIESEVHDANASQISVYVRYASVKMGETEPQGNTTMKVDVASKITAVTSEEYGFVKWAAFSTNDFPSNKQYSNLKYISENDYNKNYKEKELPDSLVHFSNPKNPTTEVKILSSRSDIFIIPIVAERPNKKGSFPKDTSEDNVKNTSITVYFSKAINRDSLIDSEGNLNFSITSMSFNAYLAGDASNIEEEDITDYFEHNLDATGTILSFTLKENKILGSNQTITVTLFEDICDSYGFKMKGNETFTFDTGTQSDNLSPIIRVLLGGDGKTRLGNFVSYHTDTEEAGSATVAAENAPKNINDNEYTSAMLAQRVYDKLYLYVKAEDIIGAGANAPKTANTLKEQNVRYIGIKASIYVENKDDNNQAVTKNRLELQDKIEKKNLLYVSDYMDEKIDTSDLFSELFEDVVPLELKKDGTEPTPYTGGEIFSYDLRNLPDGLIKIDVWGMDKNNNSGDDFAKAAAHYKNHDNAYKSIFVVKDTTPISEAEAEKIDSNSDDAPYHWYNANTYKTMKLYDGEGAKKIHDAGHEKLRSLDKNLWWNFSTNEEPDASGWQLIHDENNNSIPYLFNKANLPAKDGPFDINVFMKDDMGNLSTPVGLKQIMYDNTKPIVTLKKGKGDFVTAQGDDDLHVSGTEDKVIEQILKVTIDEKNEDNAGSGIRRIEIHVKKDGQEEVAVPLDPTKFAVKYAPASIANPTPASNDVREIHIVPAGTDSSMANLDENKIKVFDVTDSTKITSGTLFIYGITLGDLDGTYKVEVDLYDSAMNKTPATAVTQISRDTTDPKIEKVQVMDVISRKVYGHDDETWWLPYDRFEDADNLSKVTLKITANEAGSGLKNIKLAENAEFTENTELYIGDERLEKDVAYKLDTATKTIELLDWYTPKLINADEGSHVITLKNIKLNNINAPAGSEQGNKISLTVDDFVGKTKSENTITYGDTSVTGTLVYADSLAPQIATLTVEDSQDDTADDFDNKAYDKEKYTNNQNVVLYLTLGDTEVGNKGSGVNKVILSDNAVFTDTTEIFVVDGSTETKLTKSNDYTIESDNKSVNFTKVFTETNKLKFKNVKLSSNVNGNQIIKAVLQDFAGIKSTISKDTNSIVYDNLSPVVSSIKWFTNDATVTVGQSNEKIVLKQDLKVEFTDATAGVKVLKMDIIHVGVSTDAYATPFGTDFKLLKADGKPFKDTEYTIDGQYIILNTPSTNGTVFLHGITLKDTKEEGTYAINVTLLDAAENRIDTDSYTNSQNHKPNIVIDTVAPVISKKLEIPGLKQTTELSTETPSLDGYWLKKEYINGDGTGKAPDEIPVYITLKEKSSGVKVLKFVRADKDHPSDVKLSNATTLWTVAADGTETEVLPKADRYEVHPDTNEIIIKSELDAKNNFSRQDESEFKILIKNVGFVNTDVNNENEKKASTNKIYLTASDVAQNTSDPQAAEAARILSDSISPAAPASLTLIDRDTNANAPKAGTIGASNGYTNESIVDMNFSLTDSEKFGSGYHKFVLTGASFIGGDSADKTTITVKDSSGTVIPNVEFALSADGKTLTLKKTGQATDVYAVIRQAVSVELKNVQLDNASTNGSHTVTLKAYDLTGWDSTAVSTSITLDTQKPALEKGVFVANFTNSNAPKYYQPTINIYPHIETSDIEGATGVLIDYGIQTSQKGVPTFYTATTYKTGYYQVSGEVSQNSSSVDKDFDHGVVLGIHAKDNIMLGGYNRDKTYLYYYKYSDTDTLFSKSEADILVNSINPEQDINSKRQPTGSTAQSTSLWFGFDEGKYSAVIVDEAGNCSSVFHFAVVEDTDKPAKSTTVGDDDNLNERVLLQIPGDAKLYTKANIDVIDKTKFPEFKARYINSSNIRTKPYITKKTSTKYKIQLKLGSSYTADNNSDIKRIDNSAASTSPESSYSELVPTKSSSPIEQYAISTFYGAWPNTATAEYTYSPVVPYNTPFPSGERHTLSNSSTGAKLGRDYFGYGSAHDTSYWRFYDEGLNHWHLYKSGTTYTDSYTNATNLSFTSYVDSNNNLIIEIPNNTSTAPISVFLKDGCGNMQYVVCGVDTYTDTDNKQREVAVSFILDNKLGNATTSATSDGRYAVTTPVIIQNPHLSLAASGDEDTHPWNGVTFKWNNQSGNAYKKIGDTSNYHDGVAEEFGFFKDKAKYATYYNPRLYTDADNYIKEYYTTATDKKNWAKLALTLQFESGNEEPVKFTSGADMPVLNTDNAENNDAYEYTCRAKLYCTTSTDVPTYTTIKNAALESSNPVNVTGFATDWVGVKSVSGQVTICLDYPQPDYDRLGWIVNNSTTHEPVPYYMWYVFEDRVGNYEIGKVVNNRVTGSSLKNAPSPSGTVFDKWLYDGAAPVVTVVNTTKTPDQITNTQSDVSALISENNGFVPYLDTSNNSDYKNHTVWLNTSEQGLRNDGLARTPTGWGVTNQVEEYGNIITNRKYLPFANLTVSKEITGIRAFAWTINDKAPAYTAVASSGNTQGDRIDDDYPEGAWYAGFGQEAATEEKPLPGTKVDIGYGYTYKASDNYTNTTNSYLPNATSGKTYYQKYSGTKINTIIPQVIVNNHPNTPLYLHVMDWTGNVKTYRMGSSTSDLKFKSDISYPSRHYTETGTKDKIRSVDNEWLVRAYKPSDSDNTYIYVHIAGLGAGSSNATTGQKTMQIRLPDEYFTDAASGYKGFSLTRYDIGSLKRDTTGPYLEVDYNTYRKWSTNAASPTTLSANFYDNVGNLDYWTLKCIYDINAPAISSVSLIPQSGTTLADTVNRVFNTNKPYTHPTSAGPHSDVSSWATGELQEVYVKTTDSSKFKFKITLEEDPGDFGEAKINKWNGSSWETRYSTKTSGFATTTDNVNYEMSNYLLDCTTEGTYYQIVVTDVSSNASYQYFKMIKDNEAPVLVKMSEDASSNKPKITLGMGSINPETTQSGTTTYYYTSDADHLLKLSFAVEDKGVGTQSVLKTIKYCLTNSATESDWTTITNNNNVSISIPNNETAVETIYFKDILGNVTVTSAAKPGFTYTYIDSESESHTESIPKLTKYPYASPVAPSITEDEMTQSYTEYDWWGNPETKTKKYSIINQIQTAGSGMKDDYTEITYDPDNPVFTHLYTQKLSGTTVLIKGKGDDVIERQKLKITFPTKSNIIGYLKSNTPIELPEDPADDADKYSFTTLSYEFIEDLPLAGTDAEGNKLYTSKNRYYYAVDVVGNISSALKIIYSYEDPHVAKDIAFIMDPANSSESASDANYIDKDVKDQMINEGINFANFVEGPSTVTDANKKKPGILYFNDGWIILRCTLQEEAGGTYSETPRKVVMYDGYYDNGKFKVLSRGESDSQYFRYYCLSEKNDDNRHYCWIAFKPGKKKNNTWAVNNYDNNDEYDGAKIYFRITGTSSNSEYSRWNTDENSSNYDFGWKLDNGAPYINNTNFYTTSDNKKILKSYVISDAANTVDSQDKFVNPIVKGYDNIDASKRETNLIPAGAKIYYQVRKDGNNYYFIDKYSGGVQFKFVSSEGYTATASAADSGWADLAMPQGISKEVSNANFGGKGQYYFTLPEVTEPNHYIALFFKDALGNVSEPYYLGDKSNGAIKTWLTDKGPASVTKDATYVEGTSTYDINLNIDSGAAGAVIKTIEAENANIESVTFNGYTSQPTFSGTTFQNDEAWINNSGLTVRIKDVFNGWQKKTVKIKINDVSYDVFEIPAKLISPSDIEIGTVEWNKDAESYAIPLTFLTPGTSKSNISSVSVNVTDMEVKLSETEDKVIITGKAPTQIWREQPVVLTINGETSQKIEQTVFTVPSLELQASYISVTASAYDPEKNPNTYNLTITLSPESGAPVSKITDVSGINGTVSEFNRDETNNRITATLTPDAQKLTPQVVQLKFNNSDDLIKTISTGGDSVFTISARDLGKTDLTVEANLAEGEYNYSLTVNEEGSSNLNGLITSIIPTNATIKTTEGSDGITRDNNTVSFTLVPDAAGLKSKTISVKINNFDLDETFTIDPRALDKSDLTVSATETNGEYAYTITVNETGSDNLNSLITSVTPDNATIETAEGSDGITRNNNQVSFTLVPVTAGLKSKTISVKINNSFDLDETFTIEPRALAKSDLTVTTEANAGKYEYTITVNEEGSNNLNELITSVTPENATIETAEGSDGITRDNNTVSFTLVPDAAGWESQTISVKINNFDLDETFTIASKTFTADNINVKVETLTGNDYSLTITTTDGAPITKITKIDPSEGIIATWTHGENKIETTLTVEAGYTAKSINLIFNKTEDSEGLLVENVVTVQAKEIDKTAITIIAEGGGELKYDDNTMYNVAFNLQHDESIEIDEVSLSEDYGTLTYNKNDPMNYRIQRKQGVTVFPEDLEITIKLKNGSSFDVKIFLENKPKSTTDTQSGNGRSIFGGRAGRAEMPLNDIVGEAPKTRSISLKNWVTDLFTSDSAAASTKAEKKAKKTAKAAKTEKLVKSQTDKVLEKALPETALPASELAGVVESVSESAVDALTSNDATEATIVDDTLEPSAAMNIPVYDEPLTEAEVEASESRALIWTFIALIAAALVTAAAVLYTRRRK